LQFCCGRGSLTRISGRTCSLKLCCLGYLRFCSDATWRNGCAPDSAHCVKDSVSPASRGSAVPARRVCDDSAAIAYIAHAASRTATQREPAPPLARPLSLSLSLSCRLRLYVARYCPCRSRSTQLNIVVAASRARRDRDPTRRVRLGPCRTHVCRRRCRRSTGTCICPGGGRRRDAADNFRFRFVAVSLSRPSTSTATSSPDNRGYR